MSDYESEQELLAEIDRTAEPIKAKLLAFLDEQRVDVIIPNNLQSVGYNIPAMKAIYEVIAERGIATIAHSHDFWWEDSGEVSPTCDGVVRFYERYAPPDLPGVEHVVINRIAHDALLERKGIDATIVPNVFDFSQPEWTIDAYNADFRRRIGLSQSDILLLQATRVMDRKGIELAVDLAARLDSPPFRTKLEAHPLYDGRRFGPNDRIVLVCAGYVEQFGITGDYVSRLQARAKRTGAPIVFVGDTVKHSRGGGADGTIYSLWDSYVHADLVTYPSWWEGWGNQFIEAVFARRPVYLYEYPVYVTDLKPAGFDVVSLGSDPVGTDDDGLVTIEPARLDRATAEVVTMLTDPDRRRRAVSHNFTVARSRFSYEVLRQLVTQIIGRVLDEPG
jgi:glycosyltransferase involved in cell wall biosynthesis